MLVSVHTRSPGSSPWWPLGQPFDTNPRCFCLMEELWLVNVSEASSGAKVKGLLFGSTSDLRTLGESWDHGLRHSGGLVLLSCGTQQGSSS